jgi:putative CocE/NonD family hydrolase
LHPPHLVAIAPQQAYASLYLDYTYPGGIRSLGDPYWYAFAGGVGFARPMLSTQEASWALHPLLDGYWKQIDIDTKWSQIKVPILGFGGWPDIFQDAMARNYLGLQGPNTYLVDGPWSHGNTFDATVTQGAMLAWFDHWLMPNPYAPLPPTHVASYVMPAGPWQALSSWPAPNARKETLALTTSRRIAAAPGRPGSASYAVNTAAGAVDLQSGDHLIFTGAPLKAASTIAGAGTVRLIATLTDPTRIASGSLVDTNFVVHLYDVDPSGGQSLITRGYLKASQYRSHTNPARIPPGQAVDYQVPLWHVHYRVAAGHHLVLTLGSGESSCCLSSAPALAQPLLPLEVTVATGASGSTIALPVVG